MSVAKKNNAQTWMHPSHMLQLRQSGCLRVGVKSPTSELAEAAIKGRWKSLVRAKPYMQLQSKATRMQLSARRDTS